ncbi:MAG: hypothetical protein OXI63_22025 [Candidatus Poribacteria bacterium]|nr:hypothetical protein [Candidatus Poribacteria bacterium]
MAFIDDYPYLKTIDITIPTGFEADTPAIEIDDGLLYLAFGRSGDRDRSVVWSFDLDGESEGQVFDFSPPPSPAGTTPLGLYIDGGTYYLWQAGDDDAFVYQFGRSGNLLHTFRVSGDFGNTPFYVGNFDAPFHLWVEDSVYNTLNFGTSLGRSWNYVLRYNGVGAYQSREQVTIDRAERGDWKSACWTGNAHLALRDGERTIYAFNAALGRDSAQDGTVETSALATVPVAIAYGDGLVAIYAGTSQVALYGVLPMARATIESVQQFYGLEDYTVAYDVARLGSDRSVSEMKAVGVEMVNEGALEWGLNLGSSVSVSEQLRTGRFIPQDTVPSAEAGDSIFRTQGDDSLSRVPTGVEIYEIDGFDNIGDVVQVIVATAQ